MFSFLELQAPSITAAPPSPLRVEEGESVTLQWTYHSVGRAFSRIDFTRVVNQIAVIVAVVTSSTTIVRSEYASRLTVNATETNETITFSNITRADSDLYNFKIEYSLLESATKAVEIVIQCK